MQKIILQRLNRATAKDILSYANQYGISLTAKQAADVAALLHGKNVNIFDEKERASLITKVESITSKSTAKKVNELLNQFIR
ncbi:MULTISPECIES: DUF2624 domain-containing protein [Bacillus]|uniref:tRNA methyltransferase n=2 Tax=Bacillus TaxID=1386 RepID=A0A0M3RB25_9BACI|nr:tRNA methyltransferase [Bacillus gobiensis]